MYIVRELRNDRSAVSVLGSTRSRGYFLQFSALNCTTPEYDASNRTNYVFKSAAGEFTVEPKPRAHNTCPKISYHIVICSV